MTDLEASKKLGVRVNSIPQMVSTGKIVRLGKNSICPISVDKRIAQKAENMARVKNFKVLPIKGVNYGGV
jgi:hypothetical protein